MVAINTSKKYVRLWIFIFKVQRWKHSEYKNGLLDVWTTNQAIAAADSQVSLIW